MLHHPSSGLPAEWTTEIRCESFKAEHAGQLTPGQLNIIYRERWFHLFVPQALGGLQYSLPEAVRLQESIAWADGSMGWVVTLCAGAGLFVGYLDETLARQIFVGPAVCLAGSGQINGVAKRTKEGFEISGSWDYSSGAPHATHFTANCHVDDSGSSYTRSFIFKKEEVILLPKWQYMGLNATAGHSFSVNKLTVRHNRSFLIDPSAVNWPNPVYRYPFLQLAQTTIAVNLSGMCIYFLDLAEAIVSGKENNGTPVCNEAVKEVHELRTRFYSVLDASWQAHLDERQIPSQQLNAVSRASLQLAQRSRYWVDLVYPYCGLVAARTSSVINQVWRNIHTASQHALLCNE